MAELIHGDCLEEMEKLPPGTFRAVVTSPPYNLKSTTGRKTKSTWKRSPLMDDGYEGYSDNLPREEYIAWQRACIEAMMRVLRDDGAIFYNHHWRVQKGLLERPEAIVEGFPLRQIVIWWRQGGVNFNPGYFYPDYEMVYVIAKPDFKLADGIHTQLGSVWRIQQERNNPHPAPFPVELARRCIKAAGDGPILDPFMGSGTTGVAAKMLGNPFTGIEQSQKYLDMARERLGLSVCLEFDFGDTL